MLRTSFGRIRPGHPTTSYPGVAQLVARLLWEDRRSIHSPKSESPEVLGTVACGGNPPPEDPPRKTGRDHSTAHRHEKLAFSFSA